ncbi:MAG TPA: menaquinol-cytochrome c reductase cytochrome b subunit [Acidimicrobiales bacterium]|jgi:quinol-cytochrome oxidoreductase complex cytochrome b subunit|nr:menaquinol-cytochrome c reductase cytochrome b subunit [Actinomycetes bacterium]MDP6105653.1 menaquinol-cytochrome c reductase cytochrome b subunit [Acidimicrobiales bacterium]MCP4843721.1 menaquinol-cytochrome c reductase cytochrome b subunit [Actinomycetes bacterium]MDP6240447.1 menaquinol-cytochrome c reductase cytochrome b subunit [Acidimicrobiales bacterium]MDP7352582.1 menaquinol-cytochrome c reductase cytochrome b subunit [Acidimicrobiales bacterium]|tara:strand:+ start:17765 stop:18475 length:711 start_codon:yes stop_codon:yes gene_type:complete
MTEIPEHLRKRAEEARAKAAAAKGGGDAPAATSEGSGEKVPAELLDRGTPASTPPEGATPAQSGPAQGSGPDGHNQRLLTVVKSGSIQDTKSTPVDKVHVWPHLLVAEFLSAIIITLFTTLFSIFVNAPLLELADFNKTPNPSKAPWYFLGLQELLTMFHPMVAGVTIPGIGLFVLILAPYIDKNPSRKPEDRKFAVSLMTVHLMFWAVLVMIGSFFRGPGFNFIFPWNSGLFFEL